MQHCGFPWWLSFIFFLQYFYFLSFFFAFSLNLSRLHSFFTSQFYLHNIFIKYFETAAAIINSVGTLLRNILQIYPHRLLKKKQKKKKTKLCQKNFYLIFLSIICTILRFAQFLFSKWVMKDFFLFSCFLNFCQTFLLDTFQHSWLVSLARDARLTRFELKGRDTEDFPLSSVGCTWNLYDRRCTCAMHNKINVKLQEIVEGGGKVILFDFGRNFSVFVDFWELLEEFFMCICCKCWRICVFVL